MNIEENNLLVIKNDSKRVRKSNAVKLPNEITESMIPKYVVYYKECYNREKMLFREFFKIEKHPSVKTNRVYTSSKSNKINILDKLEQIKIILQNIENNKQENIENNKQENIENNKQENNKQENNKQENNKQENIDNIENNKQENIENNKQENIEGKKNKKIILPKYISLKKHEKDNEKYYLIFDKKIGENRQTYKAICNNKLSIYENLDEFNKKIKEKYL